MDDIKNIVESLLFVAEEPLTIERLTKIISGAQAGQLRQALEELEAEYEARQGGFFLNQVAGGYQFRTRPEYMDWIKRLLQPKPLHLSKAALETLAIIAYKQPVIRNDIEHIRGVDCGGVLRVLLERKFIRVLGRRELPGRPLIYATTRHFLEVFGLKNLKDLPTPKEIEEFGSALSQETDASDSEEQSGIEILAEKSEAAAADLIPVDPESHAENRQTSTPTDPLKSDPDA
jgi:segregation and condensation protein B